MTRTTRLLPNGFRFALVLVLASWLGGSANAYYAGGGKDAAKGNDCLIGYDGVDAEQITLDSKGRSFFYCQDCDPTCDQDGVASANGSCLVKLGACINQSGVENCTPPAALSKAKAKGKIKRVKGAAGKVVIDTSQLLQGSVCGSMVGMTIPIKETKKGPKDGKATLNLFALVKKDKAAGTPKRKDKDKLTIVCTPVPEGGTCGTTTSTTSTTSTSTTLIPAIFSFRTGLPTGNCGSVRSGGTEGTERKTLHCSGLNIGGGNSTVAEGPTPDNAETQMNIDCDGAVCTVSGRSATETGDPTNCSDTGCPFGPYLPIANSGASTCVRNTFSSPASGTLDLAGGTFAGAFPLTSTVYLTANSDLPCPLCIGGTPGVTDSGTCQTAAQWTAGCGPSPDAGMPCTPVNETGNTHDCRPGLEAPGSCGRLEPFAVNLDPITTAATSFSDPGGLFCPSQSTSGAFGCSGGAAVGTPTICPDGTTAPLIDYIDEIGKPTAAPLELNEPQEATLASVFCIPDPGNFVIKSAANLPGPGATSLPGTFLILP
jgi:hypothetical protein